MFRPVQGFDEQKAAEAAAAFLALYGKPMSKLKLIKLLYLCEREFTQQYGHPFLLDDYYSLPHGPIGSSALNGLNGQLPNNAWREAFSQDDNDINLTLNIELDELDALSDAEVDVIQEVFAQHKDKTASQLRRFTHYNCPEYEEVEERSRKPISYEDLFSALGFQDASEAATEFNSLRKAQSILR